MRFLSTVHTDVGTSKKVNQDSFCLKTAHTSNHSIAFAVLCDGMGGLKNGELASSFIVNAFSQWFNTEFPQMLSGSKQINYSVIKSRWRAITLSQGEKIMKYASQRGVSMGSTLTALLIIDSDYIFIQVGDSRIYRLNGSIFQMTKDHTIVAKEVEQKKLTAEQARTDRRKNVLLQCVGASKTIAPDIETGKVKSGDLFLLCSDGFRHEISDDEINGVLSPKLASNERVMKENLIGLIDLNKSRGEKDNITAITIKAI